MDVHVDASGKVVIHLKAVKSLLTKPPPADPPPLFFWIEFPAKFISLPSPTEMAEASVLPPAQYSQPSRKGKKAWRKNVDLTEVQQGLEQVRDDIVAG
jgi:Nop53 (60S ribosomal biogenesis)